MNNTMKKALTIAAMIAVATTAFAADITITSLAELREFIASTRYDDHENDTIRLTTDIDCGGGRFNTGDPDDYTIFAGTFDGQGHTISNFVHASAGSDDGYGVAMFDSAETGAVIKNLTLEDRCREPSAAATRRRS